MSQSDQLAELARSAPGWFTIGKGGDQALNGVAYPPDTVWADVGVPLRLFLDGHVLVQEEEPGARFPRRCPERHIQPDDTFCLGLRPLRVRDRSTAGDWWLHLLDWLLCQSTAEETGVWPPGHALDHGEAGHHHERALQLAAELGVEEDYEAAHADAPSWITDRGVHLLDPQGRAINGRAPCPLGCRTNHGRGRPRLRKDCMRRPLVLELVWREVERRRTLAAFWQETASGGVACCGRMRACGLAKPPVQASHSTRQGI